MSKEIEEFLQICFETFNSVDNFLTAFTNELSLEQRLSSYAQLPAHHMNDNNITEYHKIIRVIMECSNSENENYGYDNTKKFLVKFQASIEEIQSLIKASDSLIETSKELEDYHEEFSSLFEELDPFLIKN